MFHSEQILQAVSVKATKSYVLKMTAPYLTLTEVAETKFHY